MKKVLIILPIVAYVIIFVTLPGLTEYLYLRYCKGIDPKKVEAAVLAMKYVDKIRNEKLEIDTYITADDIRELDVEALLNFVSELNRSIEIEQEFACLRSLRYYALLEDIAGMEKIKQQLFLHLEEDYRRFQKGPFPETNQLKRTIDNIASREPELAILIGSKTK